MEQLKRLIDTYALNKNKLESYKKICDDENKEIKARMEELEVTKAQTEYYTATVSVQNRETMDEDKLLDVLKENGYADLVVRTKEYVDMDLLENAMYHEQIDADTLAAMQKCKQTKAVKVLKVVANKKGR